MLKAHHEKPKPELVTLNNKLWLENSTREDFANLEAKKEEDTESEVHLRNDQQPIKLLNQQILNDVGTNLSQLTLQHIMPVFLVQGYWQVHLTQRSRDISAFVTSSGLYQYKVMSFGMKNAPPTFQRMANKSVCIDG